MKLYCKIHEVQGKRVFACCDSEVIGKELEFRGNKVRIREEFYKGEKAGPERARELLRSADSANLVGKEAVKIALEEGIISKGEVIRLGRIPHCQVYLI